jgi:hypothetical protein
MRASCARLPERGRIMYGVIDFSVIDTDPGAASAFAPPAEFLGDYVHFLRERQRNDPGVRQHVAVVGRMLLREECVEFRGRYAVEARCIAESVWPRSVSVPVPPRRVISTA